MITGYSRGKSLNRNVNQNSIERTGIFYCNELISVEVRLTRGGYAFRGRCVGTEQQTAKDQPLGSSVTAWEI